MSDKAAHLCRKAFPEHPGSCAAILASALIWFLLLAQSGSLAPAMAAQITAAAAQAREDDSPRSALVQPAPGQEAEAARHDAAKQPADERAKEKAEAKSAGQAAEAPKAAAPPIRLFGTVEFRSPIKNLPKWERVRNLELKRPTFINESLDVNNPKVDARWQKLRKTLQNAPLKEQAQRVNNFFNQWPYKSDMDIWGVEDYWATPREFVQKSGDCEDYAISKYYALRDLGLPARQLRIVAVKDKIRNFGHAVLVVFMENDAYVLDNLTNLVLSHKRLTHYAPQYSVNEEYLWRHVKPKSTPKK